MRQFLICSECNFTLSEPVKIFTSNMPDCPHPNMSWCETFIAKKGICFNSNVDLIDATQAYQQLKNTHPKRRFQPFKKMDPVSFSLAKIESKVAIFESPAKHVCFNHIRYTPQIWMSISDIMLHLETKEYISWGWEGTNTCLLYTSPSPRD